MMRVNVVSNVGEGLNETVLVQDGTTAADLFAQYCAGQRAENFGISVNGSLLGEDEADRELTNNDRVTISPLKVKVA